MNFTINNDVLLENLNYIYRAVSTRTPMPSLTGILVNLHDDTLVLTASNSDISLKATVKDESLKITEPGDALIPGKYFMEIVKKISEKEINVLVYDNEVSLITKESNFKFNTLAIEDYPNISFDLIEKPLTLTSDDLKDIIKTTNFCASSVESRQILQGVCMTITSDKIDAVATDSYRLSNKKIQISLNDVSTKIVVPYQTLNELYKMMPAYNIDINIHLKNNTVIFEFENILFLSRLLDGKYPDVSRIIPNNFLLEAKYKRMDLISAAERATLFATSAKDNIIILNIKSGITEIRNYSNEKGSSVIDIKSANDLSGKNFSIAFSSKYLLDALETFADDEVTLHFTNQYRQFILTSEKDVDQIQLILPVRAD